MSNDSIVRMHNGAVHHAQESNAGDYGKRFHCCCIFASGWKGNLTWEGQEGER
jgi:hypothetical protein